MNYYNIIKEDKDILNLIFDYIKNNYYSDIKIEMVTEEKIDIIENIYQIRINNINESYYHDMSLMEINFVDTNVYKIQLYVYGGIPNYNTKTFISDMEALFIYHNRVKIIDSL